MLDLRAATPDELVAELRLRYDAMVFIACQGASRAGLVEGEWVYDSKGDPFRVAGLAHAADLREERALAVLLASAGALPQPRAIDDYRRDPGMPTVLPPRKSGGVEPGGGEWPGHSR